MNGLGNDFMVIDAVKQTVALTTRQIVNLGRRDIGVGFDQCLLIEPSVDPTIDFFYRIFNADGQEVGQCGNGARCLARFVHYHQLTDKLELIVSTKTTKMTLMLHDDDTVTVGMGKPLYEPIHIPLNANKQQRLYEITTTHGNNCQFHAVSVGNPHAVMLVNDIAAAAVNELGKFISEHPLFPQHCNVGFMEIVSPGEINLRVYERGCGETKACGSGAVAAVAIGQSYHELLPQVVVNVAGGQLHVSWDEQKESLFLRGPATFVYEGLIYKDILES